MTMKLKNVKKNKESKIQETQKDELLKAKNSVLLQRKTRRKMIVRDSSEDEETPGQEKEICSTKRKRSLRKKASRSKTPIPISLTPISNSPTVNTRSKTPQISITMPTIDSPALNTRGSLRRRSIGSSPVLDDVAPPLEEPMEKKKRGETKMKSVATSSEGRLPVKFNALGQPIGKASISLSSFLGPLVREVVPVTLPDWRKITLGMKEVLWRSIQARYIVDKEWKKNYIFQSMGDLWRASKSRLVAKVKKAPNEHERLKLKPDNIKTVIEWRAFIKEKTSLEFQAKSDKFKEIRNKRLPHTCSRKGYARLIDDMMNSSAKNEEPSRVDVWTKAHTKKNGEPVNSYVAETFDILGDSSLPSKTPKEKGDLLSNILGPEKGSYVRGYGKGVTKTKLAIASEKEEHICRIENEYKELKEKVAVMEQLINSFINSKSHSNLSGEQSNAHNRPTRGDVGIQGQKCDLLDWTGSGNIVAVGYFISDDPQDSVLGVPLGPFAMKVGVDFVREPNAFLWRPTSGLTCIEESVGNIIAWPADKNLNWSLMLTRCKQAVWKGFYIVKIMNDGDSATMVQFNFKKINVVFAWKNLIDIT
ncbi:hypothetical protein CsatA_027271 [Cannabis sativa]